MILLPGNKKGLASLQLCYSANQSHSLNLAIFSVLKMDVESKELMCRVIANILAYIKKHHRNVEIFCDQVLSRWEHN